MQSLSEESSNRVLAVLMGETEMETLQTPEEFHQFAWSYNWDGTVLEPLEWIIRHPQCDKGTALLIYWYAVPGYLYQRYSVRSEVPDYYLQEYDLVKEIEERFLSGFYQEQNICFDPSNDEGINWLAEYSDVQLVQTIPEEMMNKSPGDMLERAVF